MPRRESRVLAVLMTVVLSGGCTTHSFWQAQREQIEGLQETRRPVPPVGDYRDFPGVIHVHSLLSHDSKGTMDEIVAAAKQAGLAFVITTDHNNPRIYTRGFEGWYDHILVLRGSEIIKGCAGYTGETCNSVLVLGLKDYLDPRPLTMAQIIDRAKQQGGLAFVAHSGGFKDWDSPGIDGMEIYDLLDDAVDHPWRFPKYLFDIGYSYGDYADQVFLSILDRPDAYLKKWDERTQQRRWTGIAGNDAHQNIRILGRQIDPYGQSFRFVRTHILAKELTEAAVLQALVAGHAYVAFDSLSDATGFVFWAGNDALQGIQGDEVRLNSGLKLTADSPVVGLMELVRNGTVIRTATTAHLDVPVEDAGVYRVQISLRISGRWRPWVFSNPIYVRPSD
ncbi:MAG TPA: CehA/McbA family metallohydrolase [Nitrospiria bacterium]|nr:CehA/McbA family metallohydrolase [Nitrospiria bacterium]